MTYNLIRKFNNGKSRIIYRNLNEEDAQGHMDSFRKMHEQYPDKPWKEVLEEAR